MTNKLTSKQEKFVQGLIKGLSQRKAYIEAYPKAANWKESTVDSKASTLFANGKVLERYQELLKKTQDEAIMTSKERKKWLSDIVTSGEIDVKGTKIPVAAKDRLKAMDILNKMDSEYIEKHEVTVQESGWFK